MAGNAEGAPLQRVPRTDSEVASLIAGKEPGWEYMLFAALLRAEVNSSDEAYSHHRLAVPVASGVLVDADDAPVFLVQSLDEVRSVARRFELLMANETLERAFGPPGQAGDVDQIRHVARRWGETYRGLLAWSARLRGTAKPSRWDRAFEVVAQFMDAPVAQSRAFVDTLVRECDAIPTSIAGKHPLRIEVVLKLDLDSGALPALQAELERLRNMPAE